MPVSPSSSSSSTTIGHHIRHQRFAGDDDETLLIPKPSRRVCNKSAMSSFFLLPSSSSSSSNETKKKQTQTPSFRGLGCASSSASKQVSIPAAIRSSADWDSNTKKTKSKKKKEKSGCYNGGSVQILSEIDRSGGGIGCAAIPDVWCGPGVSFSTDAVVGDSIGSGESENQRRNIPTRRKIDGDNKNINNNTNQREGSSVLPRRSINQESDHYIDSDSVFSTTRAEHTLFSDRYHRHIRQQPYNDGLSEMMMIHNGFVMGGIFSTYDHFRNMRLNVDNMTYEQLLELGDRIGYVNIGLNEKQIKTCLRKVVPFRAKTPLADRKCIICQDEYETKDEVGMLRCGHRFHINCVKQWLLRKNSCPICKTMPFLKP
ncbi:unnamed protein product [Cochlearia groenlandica]